MFVNDSLVSVMLLSPSEGICIIFKYAFVIDERDSDVLYFVLYQTDDVEAGKVFEYEISYDEEGKIILGEQKESMLIQNDNLLEKVKAVQ